MCCAFIPASRCKDAADDRRMFALPDGCPARHTAAAATNKAGRKMLWDIFLAREAIESILPSVVSNPVITSPGVLQRDDVDGG